ncbi:MAG: response regulator [Verrucomicrobiota bacterium]
MNQSGVAKSIAAGCPTKSGIPAETIHLLLVDDNPGDVFLVQELLRDAAESQNFQYSTASTLAEAMEIIAGGEIEVILLDLTLPDAAGVSTIEKMTEFCGETPVIILSGMQDEQLALHAVREGAQDYLCKNELQPAPLVRTIRHAMERHRLQHELEEVRLSQMHTQKLESLGVLTGGIAHDFNNILGAIMGYAELCQRAELPHESVSRYMENVIKGCRRGSDLCKQMLAYAGQANVDKTLFYIEDIAKDLSNFIRVSVDRSIAMDIQLDNQNRLIEADISQVRQVLLNFLTNASEALPEGKGRITVRSGEQHLRTGDLKACWGERAKPGNYAWFEVEDNGCGIPEDKIKLVFDPFYTTKFDGRGLGLSAVLGVINNHRGALFIDTEVDQGSRFRAYFPISEKEPEPKTTNTKRKPTAWGREAPAVLIADDEPNMRNWLYAYFDQLGYRVYIAEDGNQAMEIHSAHSEEIQVAMVDITMPGSNSEEVFCDLLERNPDLALIAITGHSPDEAKKRLGVASTQHITVCHKPFDIALLEEALRQNACPV